MDRREIFEKYVQEGSEHSIKILPYSNDDPELIGNRHNLKITLLNRIKLDWKLDKLILENASNNTDIKTNSGGKQNFNGIPICTSNTSNKQDGMDHIHTCRLPSSPNTSQHKNSPIQVRCIEYRILS